MGRECTVCAHPDAVLINEALVLEKRSNRGIAGQYGLTQASVQRHREHIPQLLVKASRAAEIANADDLLESIRVMVGRIEAFLDRAEANEDGAEFRAHAGEWRKQVELLAKIAGDLQQEGTTNIILSPEYLELRTAILVALEPHPEAAASVSRAMLEIEQGRP